jgi:hypothetical protein
MASEKISPTIANNRRQSPTAQAEWRERASAGAGAPGSWLPFFIHGFSIARGRGMFTFLRNGFSKAKG